MIIAVPKNYKASQVRYNLARFVVSVYYGQQICLKHLQAIDFIQGNEVRQSEHLFQITPLVFRRNLFHLAMFLIVNRIKSGVSLMLRIV